jgi:hypothetical protein
MNIYDELEHAEYLLEHGFTKFMSGPEILILAKYFRSLGQNNNEIEQNIYDFCEKFEPEYNETIYAKKIHDKILYSAKTGLRTFVPIPITANEMEKIRSVKNYRYEKVLFVSLVLAKYYKITNPVKKDKSHIDYYLKEKFSKILSLAHVIKKKDEDILSILYDLGVMTYNKGYDSYHIAFTNSEDTSEIVVSISDMDNIIGYYPPRCRACGKNMIRNSNRHETCDNCFLKSKKVFV